MKTLALAVTVCLLLTACHAPSRAPEHSSSATTDTSSTTNATWAIALHGGAGVIPKSMAEEEVAAYRDGLTAALEEGKMRLERGESALDVAEHVVRRLEDDPHFNAGRGAVFTAEGRHELDASFMDGATLGCGAVTGVTTVRHPITLARRVMERSPHVFFAAEGAEAFADTVGVERVQNSYFDTDHRREALERALSEHTRKKGGSTVGCVVRDKNGHLAAATSTGGMTAKRFGRVGDSPIIGAGTYANDRSCAVSCTGTGEEFIRHTVARDIAALMEYRGLSVNEAARVVVFEKLAKDDGGIIAVGKNGDIALVFNTAGMFRGAADSNGRFDVAIWED